MSPEGDLKAGLKVSFGRAMCGMVDDSTLKCRECEAGVSIAGSNRAIKVREGVHK